MKFFKTKTGKILLVILFAGLFLRIFKFQELFYYAHDHDLASWVIRDIVENKHFRLIGQETSTKGVFIGALYYYLLIPFYFLANWDPIGGILLSTIIGLTSILSTYFVFSKIFNKKVGLIGSLVYASSFLIVFTDREVVPTTPVMLWSIWFLFSLHLILKGEQLKGFLLASVLGALIWHLNLSLLLLFPLIPFAFLLSKKRINFRSLILSALTFLILSAPFFIFEIRHNFQQVNSIFNSLTTDSSYIEGTAKGLGKLDRTMQLVYKNVTSLFYGPIFGRFPRASFVLLLISLFILLRKKLLGKNWVILFSTWILLFIAFFSLNSINLSEYYLNGMNIVWIVIFSLVIYFLHEKEQYKKFAIFLLGLFVGINLLRFFLLPINQSGYIQRKAIVNFIKEDAIKNNYPCVSVSYITSPGNELGYRYLFFIEKMHVNQPKGGSPVYSIVFPHSKVDRLDKTFGALGLVLPDYSRYNKDSVDQSCRGENSNLTDPLFGFTK